SLADISVRFDSPAGGFIPGLFGSCGVTVLKLVIHCLPSFCVRMMTSWAEDWVPKNRETATAKTHDLLMNVLLSTGRTPFRTFGVRTDGGCSRPPRTAPVITILLTSPIQFSKRTQPNPRPA